MAEFEFKRTVSVASKAALKRVAPSVRRGIKGAMLAHVTADNSFWVFDPTSADTPSATVLQPNAGTGRWHAIGVSRGAKTQGTWHIDPTNGNDDNDGTTTGTALETHAELARRWGEFGELQGQPSSASGTAINLITVYIYGNLPVTDPINIRVTLPPNTLLAYVGVPTSVGTGTVGSYVAKDRANRVPVSFTRTLVSGTDIALKSRIRITSGANENQYAWAAKDLTGGAWRVSAPINASLPDPPDRLFQRTFTLGAFANSDPYEVLALPTCYLGAVDIQSSNDGSGTPSTVGFASLDFQSNGSAQFSFINAPKGAQFIAKGCRFRAGVCVQLTQLRYDFLDCCFDDACLVVRGSAFLFGGLGFGGTGTLAADARMGALVAVDADFMAQGTNGRFRAFGGGIVTIGLACAFDWSGGALTLGGSSTSAGPAFAQLATGSAGSHLLWGESTVTNAGGVLIEGGSRCVYDATIPNITGSGTGGYDLKLADSTNGQAFDKSTSPYSFTADRSMTWANVAATVAGGGFGGNAHNYDRDAHFVKRA